MKHSSEHFQHTHGNEILFEFNNAFTATADYVSSSKFLYMTKNKSYIYFEENKLQIQFCVGSKVNKKSPNRLGEGRILDLGEYCLNIWQKTELTHILERNNWEKVEGGNTKMVPLIVEWGRLSSRLTGYTENKTVNRIYNIR